MNGQNIRFRGDTPPPPPLPQPPALIPFLLIPNMFIQNPNPFLPDPNFLFQNPNFMFPPNHNFIFQNPNLLLPSNPEYPKLNNPNPKPSVEKIDRAVVKARDDLMAAGGHVSAWEAAQAALLGLGAGSWESLGVPMQQVPSLNRLIVIEGKINAFIHCFVAVRRITTLHDLDVAICKNEGVERYEELELGPLVRHPLVMHYFSVSSDVKDIFKITSGEIISCLCEFIDIHKGSGIVIDEFLDFAANQRSVSGREKLYVRIQSFGMQVDFIRKAMKSESDILKRCLKGVGIKKQHIDSSPSLNKDFSGTSKHIRFVSSNLEKNNSEEPEEVYEKSEDFEIPRNILPPNPGSSDQPSRCPYSSADEERSRFGLKKADVDIEPSSANYNLDYKESNRVSKRKRKTENKSGKITTRIKVPKTVRDDPNVATKSKKALTKLDKDVTVDDIVQKVSDYFELDNKILRTEELALEPKLNFLRKLCKCEFWLAKQFSVKKFKSLGYGKFFTFLEKHASLLHDALRNCLTGETPKKPSLEVCMHEQQLVLLLSQAANSFGKDKKITKRMISPLLTRQFPLVNFVLPESGIPKDFMKYVKKKGSLSTCVLFSAALLARHNGDLISKKEPSGTSVVGTDIICPVTTKDAIKLLLKAPMLSDLISWSHWEIVFAPTLGPLVRWLMNEVKVKEILCLVTNDGKVIRVNNTASLESFSKACIQGSSFEAAVELLSILPLYGGESNVPLSLLKSHARQAFKKIMKKKSKTNENKSTLHGSNSTCREKIKVVVSRFFIDCLGHLPGEFQVFAADILLSGLQFVWKDAPSVILRKCKENDQRRLLHIIGRSLDIVEWIRDYNLFASSITSDLMVSSDTNSEIPPQRSFSQTLLELSAAALPSQTAKKVFEVFLRLSDEMNSGSLNSDDLIHLKEHLQKLEFTVLPTLLDKWVSLHPSFGFVFWCDDNKLKKEFKRVDNIELLDFGELSVDEQELLRSKVSVVMQTLGIPSLSEVITREAIYYGLEDCSNKTSLLNWAFPYAQRYIYNVHGKKYSELKKSEFEFLSQLRIIVVDKLFSRNIIKESNIASRKRRECKCLLQGNLLYATQDSDSYSLFMELSSLLFGVPNLNLANFLHMIITLAESGSNNDQIDFFILKSQKIPKLPDCEPVWALQSSSSIENNETLQTNNGSTFLNPCSRNSWPPVDWNTAPVFSFPYSNGMKMQSTNGTNNIRITKEIDSEIPTEIDAACNASAIEKCDPKSITAMVVQPDSQNLENQNNVVGSVILDLESDSLKSLPFFPNGGGDISQLPNAQELFTGRMGEHVAYNYFLAHAGNNLITWVNQDRESGLPYDLVVKDEQRNLEFIEVKATKSSNKDWFHITLREWQFALEKGEYFTIAHVILSGHDVARITMFKNPVKLCQLGKLQLAMHQPKLLEEFSTT